MPQSLPIEESELPGACPALLDRLAGGAPDRIERTRAAVVTAVLTAAEALAWPGTRDIFGCLRGAAVIPPGLDLTAPVREPFRD